MAPVIRELQERSIDFILIHSNQHYSKNMDEVFFQELQLPKPKYNLNVGSGTHSNQTGNILIKIEPILEKETPGLCACAGRYKYRSGRGLGGPQAGLKVAHIEAGLRSYDRTMPEESNRVMTDHISDLLFAVTDVQKQILQAEGIEEDKIVVVWEYDHRRRLAEQGSSQRPQPDPSNAEHTTWRLLPLHRPSGLERDSRPALQELVALLTLIPLPVVWPIHARAKKQINDST